VEVIVRIGGDPTSWTVAGQSYETMTEELSNATGPVVIQVISPLVGSLVLSHRAAGSVAVIQPPGGVVFKNTGSNPGHEQAPTTATLYLASPAGPGPGAMYAASNANFAAAVQEVSTAMANGAVLALSVYDASGTGTLLINGAALPFAVVC
jgi:hypothetical protein